MIDESKERIESKYVEDSLEQLVNKTRNIKTYIENLNAFTNYERIIKNYKSKLNISSKDISLQIKQNKYNDEIDGFLKTKLCNLTNILSEYYNEVNSSFLVLKDDLINSIKNMNDSLCYCVDVTKIVLNAEYKNISDSTARIDKNITNYIDKLEDPLKYKHKAENMMNNGTAYVRKISEYAEFKLDLTLEGNKFKIPKVKAKIVNKIVPKDVLVNVMSGNGFCIEKGYQFNIGLTDANYIMTVEYDTKSSYINITTYTNIENYQYTLQLSETKGDMITKEVTVENYTRTFECVNRTRTSGQRIIYDMSASSFNETMIVFK